MRRLRLAFAAGALAAGLALGAAWLARAPSRPTPAPTGPSPIGVAPGVEPRAAPINESLARAPGPSAAARGPAQVPDSSLADAELIALEERALRRIDVVAMLEAAGIDARQLQRRRDADDVLRHLAGDELLALAYMRQLFGMQVYPRSHPREAALREARAAAEEAVTRLSPEERKTELARELARPELPMPEPVYSDDR